MGKRNVRQIGQIRGVRGIYIEDYAMTYLRQLAEGRGDSGSVAVLVGTREREEEKENFYIYGVLELTLQREEPGRAEEGWLGDGEWGAIYARMREYFPDREILGWYLAAEGREIERDERIIRFHKNNFGGENRFFFYCDPGALEEVVYFYEEGRMKRQSGYYIFYEKNEEMQSLLVERRQREGGVRLSRVGESMKGGEDWNREKKPETQERVVQEIRRTLEGKKEKRPAYRMGNGWTSYLAGAVTAVAALAICLVVLGYFDRLHSLEETVRQMEETLQQMPGDQLILEGQRVEPSQTEMQGGVLEIETLVGGVETIPEKTEKEPGLNEDAGEEPGSNEGGGEEPEKLQDSVDRVVESEKTEEKGEVIETVTPTWVNYVVQPGDTLSAICQHHYHDVHMIDRVMEVNGLGDPNEILAGDVLILPGS